MAFDPNGQNKVVVLFNGMKLESAQLNDDPIISAETLTNIANGTGQGALPVDGNNLTDITSETGEGAGGGRRKKSAKRGRKPKRKKTAKRRK